jgi:hypothetical protein
LKHKKSGWNGSLTLSKFSVVGQLCNLIPPHLVCKLSRRQHALCATDPRHRGPNDVCDALRLQSGPLSALRGATAPSRNNLSHANKHRDAALAERLFWTVLDHLQKLSPGFSTGRRGKGLARRFRRVIHVVDSSTIALNCFLHSLLPRFVLVESAKAADSIRRNTSKHTTFETSVAMAGISAHKNQ